MQKYRGVERTWFAGSPSRRGKFLFIEMFHVVNEGVIEIEYHHFVIPNK